MWIVQRRFPRLDFPKKNFLGMHRISGPFVIRYRLTGILLDTGYGGRISHRIWRPVILPDIRPIIQLGLLQQKPTTTSCCRKSLIHRTVCRVFYGYKKKFGWERYFAKLDIRYPATANFRLLFLPDIRQKQLVKFLKFFSVAFSTCSTDSGTLMLI